MSRRNRIRTLLYGDQRLLPGELDLISTPTLQRLYDLHQLGLADRVFIDASHSRLHHVIGVLEQVEKLTDAIIRNLKSNSSAQFWITEEICFSGSDLADEVERKKPIARLIGLLHDLTHAPFGHTVEDEIELIACKHDDPDRQAEAFYRLLCQYIGWLAKDADVQPRPDSAGGNENERGLYLPAELHAFLHRPDLPPPDDAQVVARFAVRLLTELPSEVIRASWRLTPVEVASLLSQLHAAMTGLLHMELLHKNEPEEKHFPKPDGYAFQSLINDILKELPDFDKNGFMDGIRFQPRRDAYLLDIVGNTVCADLLDYAHRDAHFTNIRLDYDEERIADNFTIVCWDATTYRGDNGRDHRKVVEGREDPFGGRCLRTAISLFSHKFRIDAPGELMNLLNVRFYIYERVLFHPTKCAAGAMLGTALQLIGWRPLRDGERGKDLLPSYLRQVGDQVFLHDIAAGARLTLELLRPLEDDAVPAEAAREFGPLPACPQALIAKELLMRRKESGVGAVRSEITAGLNLLDRLRARRYFRPVFRALPNAYYEDFDLGAKELADTFRDAQRRYQAERNIEARANLRPGTVVIHCPPRSPAQKIANVLLTLPGGQQEPKIRKLRHINEIDKDVFGNHREAIKAVEEMYNSMWRLVVYVSPSYLSRYQEIAEVAGKVIAQTLNDHLDKPQRRYGDAQLPNDPQLERELERRLKTEELPPEATPPAPAEEEPAPGGVQNGAALHNLLEELAKEYNPALLKHLAQPEPDLDAVRNELLAMGFKGYRKSRVERNGGNLESRFFTLCRVYYGGRIPSGMSDELKAWYRGKPSTLPNSEQVDFLAFLSDQINATPQTSGESFMRPPQLSIDWLDDFFEKFVQKLESPEDD